MYCQRVGLCIRPNMGLLTNNSLALIESQLILAYLLSEYDFELGIECRDIDWKFPNAVVIPFRRSLFVKMKARAFDSLHSSS